MGAIQCEVSNPVATLLTTFRSLVLCGLVVVTLGFVDEAPAQAKIPRVGILAQRDAAALPIFQVFERALAGRGWDLGKTVMLEYQAPVAEDQQYTEAAQELVRQKVDLIYASSAPALHAAYAATQSIPIVAGDFSTDPIAAGYVESYGHPGKNVTGVFLDAPEFTGKWLEILKRLIPKLSRVAVLWDPNPGAVHLRGVQSAGRALGIRVQVFEVRKPEDIDRAFAAFGKPIQAVVQLPSPLMYAEIPRIAGLARQRRLIGISIFRRFAEVGGAVGYGPDTIEVNQRVAVFVDKILRGAKPSDLPIERPTKYDFLINTKTVAALGIKVPEALLLSAELVNK